MVSSGGKKVSEKSENLFCLMFWTIKGILSTGVLNQKMPPTDCDFRPKTPPALCGFGTKNLHSFKNPIIYCWQNRVFLVRKLIFQKKIFRFFEAKKSDCYLLKNRIFTMYKNPTFDSKISDFDELKKIRFFFVKRNRIFFIKKDQIFFRQKERIFFHQKNRIFFIKKMIFFLSK